MISRITAELGKFLRRKRNQKTALELIETPFTCHSCGEEHRGPFDLAVGAPDNWEGPREPEQNGALRMDGDFLSADFCVIGGEHFYLRGLLEIPVKGLTETFAFGGWSTLSRMNFEVYLDHFDDRGGCELGPWTGWLGNSYKPYPDSFNEPCWVYPQATGLRPLILLENLDHPLTQAQEHGITPEELLAIYQAHGHGPADALI